MSPLFEHQERENGEEDTVEQEEARPEETDTDESDDASPGVNREEQGYGGQAE
jgi:hypothetical protein